MQYDGITMPRRQAQFNWPRLRSTGRQRKVGSWRSEVLWRTATRKNYRIAFASRRVRAREAFGYLMPPEFWMFVGFGPVDVVAGLGWRCELDWNGMSMYCSVADGNDTQT